MVCNELVRLEGGDGSFFSQEAFAIVADDQVDVDGVFKEQVEQPEGVGSSGGAGDAEDELAWELRRTGHGSW